MPTYGYRCTACSNEFDLWQSMRDEAHGDCPKCGAPGKRLFFAAGIVFKGTGFYKTDSRSSATGGTSGSGGSSGAGPAKPTTPPTDGSSGSESASPAGAGTGAATTTTTTPAPAAAPSTSGD